MSIIRLGAAFALVACISVGNAGAVVSATEIAGVYTGNFTGTCGNGSFALLVSSDDTAALLAFSTSDRAVDQRENLQLDSSGALNFSGFLGRQTSVHATFSRNALAGTIFGACGGQLTGAKAATRGFLENAGGYYAGIHNGSIDQEECVAIVFPFICVRTAFKFVGTYSGSIFAIVAANGAGYVLFKSSDTSRALNVAGDIVVTSGRKIDCGDMFEGSGACALDGPVFVIDQNVNCCTVFSVGWILGDFFTDTLTVAGTFDVSETKFGNVGFGLFRLKTRKKGPFTMARQRPLPPPETTSLPWLRLMLQD